MVLEWDGDQVKAKMRRAQAEGINSTMAGSAVHAKRNHAWRNQTGTLEGSLDVVEFATPDGKGQISGVWGSRDVRYARIQELGGTIRPVNAKALFIPDAAGGIAAVVQEVTIPARPYLRPAADAVYPTLAKRIRQAFERAGT